MLISFQRPTCKLCCQSTKINCESDKKKKEVLLHVPKEQRKVCLKYERVNQMEFFVFLTGEPMD